MHRSAKAIMLFRYNFALMKIYNKNLIIDLHKQGKDFKDIVKIIGCAKSTVSYYIGKRGTKKPNHPCKNCQKNIIASKVFCSQECHLEYKYKNRSNRLKSGQLLDNNTIRDALFYEGLKECSIYGISSEWNGKPLTLQIDHINGNSDNNNYDNLRLVCPNCHSQLETTTSKIKKQTRRNSYLRKHKGYALVI